MDSSPWWALFAPKGTAQPILDRLSGALDKALDDENTRKRLIELGGEIPDKDMRGPQALALLVKSDIARSVELQNTLWQQAIQLSDDDTRSLAVNRFINSLNEMNNVHERRLTALRYHVPYAVTSILIGVTMLVIGLTRYHEGITGTRRHGAH
jgi:hypothetical protein